MGDHPLWFLVFNVFVVFMLVLDLGVFHRKDSVMSVKVALGWSAFWIALALVFNAGVYMFYDHGKAVEFFTAYVLEKSLSVDNLFVFVMLFGFFRVDRKHQHKVLFWGILGALVMRALFILAGVALIREFSWIMYIFGVFLIYSGIKMLFGNDEDKAFDPNKNAAVRLFKKFMPVTDEHVGSKFFLRRNHTTYATPLFICLLFVEMSDLIFAIDSIPAVLAVSDDPFIVYTSNVFAILGLRSLYFALNGVMSYFHYLKYALAAILSFIGIKMCVNELCHHFGCDLHIRNEVSLSVIILLLTISIVASIYRKKRRV